MYSQKHQEVTSQQSRPLHQNKPKEIKEVEIQPTVRSRSTSEWLMLLHRVLNYWVNFSQGTNQKKHKPNPTQTPDGKTRY